MKTISIARKTLLEYLREPLTLGMIFFFPILMIALYDLAFGETDQGLAKYLKVAVLNEDVGVTTPEGAHWEAGAELLGWIRDAEWEGAPIFDLTEVTDQRYAEISLRERKIALLLVIPPDFSQALAEHQSTAELSLVGYPNSGNFVFARSFLDDFLRWFKRYAEEGSAALEQWQTEPVVRYEFLAGTGTMSDFDFGVPGVIVFGLALLTISTAQTLVNEKVNGTLRRLRLTNVRARDLLLGVALAQMAVALILVPVTFGAAMAMGFGVHGSLLPAIGVSLLLTLAWVGLGLGVACFANNDGEAANLGGVVAVLMVLMSDAMYPMPDVPIVTIAGRTIQIWDLLPTSHAAGAMRRLLVSGESLSALGYELGAMLILSILILSGGVVLYQRLQMRPD
jgi:ABC-2 type transport system permease protein